MPPPRLKVKMSIHAKQRWNQLDMGGRPVTEISSRLYESLRRGVLPDKDGAVHVYIRDEAYAVCMPDLAGGWIIITIYIPGVNLESA